MPILLLEGTRGVGKTTIGTLLSKEGARSPEGLDMPIKLVPQRLTFGLLGPMQELGILDEDLARVVLGRFVEKLARTDTSDQWIVLDTLHVTLWVRGALGVTTFAAVDDAIAKIGARGVLLRASIESIEARRMRDDRSRCERWFAEQQTMLELCGSSAVPFTVIDADPPLHIVHDAIRTEILESVPIR